MRVRSWQDTDLEIRVYTSTDGDAIQYGTRTEYPFVAGGAQGVAVGWVPFFHNTSNFDPVNVTTAYGRFSISAKDPATLPINYYWGMSRRFPVKPGYRYQVNIQAQTMENRSPGNRYLEVYAYSDVGGSIGHLIASKRASQSTWERLGQGTAVLSSTYKEFEIRLTASWDNTIQAPNDDKNIGVQWQGLSITEQPQTPPVPQWREVTCDVQGVTVRYGRDRFTNRFDVGTFSVQLLNDDGKYSFQDYPVDGFRPGRFVKGTLWNSATASVEYPFFYGLIDSVTDGYSLDGHAVSVIQALDPSTLLANQLVPTASYSTSTTYDGAGARITNLLRAAGWFSDRQGIYADTNFVQQAIMASGRTIRDECAVSAESEGGLFYADQQGRIVYFGRNYEPSTMTLVQAELLAQPYDGRPLEPVDAIPDWIDPAIICVSSIGTTWGRDRIINDLDLANQGGSAFSFDDFESQAAYGPFTYQRLDFVNDNSHPEYIMARADDIMTGYTQSVLRVNSVTFKPQSDDWRWLRTVFLNHLVRVRYINAKNYWGFATATHIQGIEHRITVEDWEITLNLDQPESFRWWDDVRVGGNGWDEGVWDENVWNETDGANWSAGKNWSDPASKWGY